MAFVWSDDLVTSESRHIIVFSGPFLCLPSQKHAKVSSYVRLAPSSSTPHCLAYSSDTVDRHSNSPYKRPKGRDKKIYAKTKRRSHKSRVIQGDDTLAGTQAPLHLASANSRGDSLVSADDDSSGSWYSIYDGDVPLVARSGVCSGNTYYYPSEESTGVLPATEGAPRHNYDANDLSLDGLQHRLLEKMDMWIASYSQRTTFSGGYTDASNDLQRDDAVFPLLGYYSTVGNAFQPNLEARGDGEPLSPITDAERSEAYTAWEDEFCVYDHHQGRFMFDGDVEPEARSEATWPDSCTL